MEKKIQNPTNNSLNGQDMETISKEDQDMETISRIVVDYLRHGHEALAPYGVQNIVLREGNISKEFLNGYILCLEGLAKEKLQTRSKLAKVALKESSVSGKITGDDIYRAIRVYNTVRGELFSNLVNNNIGYFLTDEAKETLKCTGFSMTSDYLSHAFALQEATHPVKNRKGELPTIKNLILRGNRVLENPVECIHTVLKTEGFAEAIAKNAAISKELIKTYGSFKLNNSK